MGDLPHYPDEVWDRFFDFVYPCDEKLPGALLDEELQRMGIDVTHAVKRVHQALAAARAREELAAAKAARESALARLGEVVVSGVSDFRARLRGLIEGKCKGTLRAALFRKLEAAATDEDLQSLIEDIHRLDALQ